MRARNVPTSTCANKKTVTYPYKCVNNSHFK